MRDLLTSASDVYKTADVKILLVGHCLLVSSWFRDPWRNRFLLCYWVGAQSSGSSRNRACAHRVTCAHANLWWHLPACIAINRARISDPMLQIGLIAAFGGGIASSILLQRPDKAAIAILSDNNMGL